jgi:class 3 adenylate cyclase
MGLGADLQANVTQFIKTTWTRTEGRVVPEPEAIGMGNEGIELKEAVCLYADLADSTGLVNAFDDWFAAVVYKCFLHCAVKIVRSEGGTITSFDGDRVMGVFVSTDRFNSAARAALKINWATSQMVEPAIKANWKVPSVQALQIRHTVGIDASKVFAARTGARGSNDIVWVGRAPNYAAKLATWRDPRVPTLITADVFAGLSGVTRDTNGVCIWAKDSRAINGVVVYSSNYHMPMT